MLQADPSVFLESGTDVPIIFIHPVACKANVHMGGRRQVKLEQQSVRRECKVQGERKVLHAIVGIWEGMPGRTLLLFLFLFFLFCFFFYIYIQ